MELGGREGRSWGIPGNSTYVQSSNSGKAGEGARELCSCLGSGLLCPTMPQGSFLLQGEGCYVLLFLLSPPPSILHCPP